MATLEQSSEKVSADVVDSIKKNIERLVRDVFLLMFNLTLFDAPDAVIDDEDSVTARLVLRHEKIKVCISFRIKSTTAEIIAKRVGIVQTDNQSLALYQDVVCELTNIVGNNLRTVLSEVPGLYFDFDIPNIVVGEACPCEQPSPNIVFKKDFEISPEAHIRLSLVCDSQGASPASPIQAH
ncbi:MAG: chemotaxis protein CheX [Alphaproteobacteria bacterium]|nr:chemotaxis protein CheX [Alphaproteobacteria bacterium]